MLSESCPLSNSNKLDSFCPWVLKSAPTPMPILISFSKAVKSISPILITSSSSNVPRTKARTSTCSKITLCCSNRKKLWEDLQHRLLDRLTIAHHLWGTRKNSRRPSWKNILSHQRVTIHFHSSRGSLLMSKATSRCRCSASQIILIMPWHL